MCFQQAYGDKHCFTQHETWHSKPITLVMTTIVRQQIVPGTATILHETLVHLHESTQMNLEFFLKKKIARKNIQIILKYKNKNWTGTTQIIFDHAMATLFTFPNG
ncbi:hypothetical protein ACJX0J_018843, partial [Zea mays]